MALIFNEMVSAFQVSLVRVFFFSFFYFCFIKLISRFAVMLRPPSSSSFVECAFPFISPVKHEDMPNKWDNRQNRLQVNIGPCKWIFSEKCPNSDIKFYLYTRKNPQDRQLIHVDETWDKSNLSNSNFNPSEPSKIIVHGYNSDMFLTPLIQMKGGMFVFTIDFMTKSNNNNKNKNYNNKHRPRIFELNFQTLLSLYIAHQLVSFTENFLTGVIYALSPKMNISIGVDGRKSAILLISLSMFNMRV